MKKNSITLIAAMVIASACAGISGAQTLFREWNADSRGRGTIRLENQQDDDLTAASVVLRRDGTAEIRLTGRNTMVFTGRWTGGNSYDVDLDITGGFGNASVNGRGRVTLTRGGGFDRLELSGRNRGRDFSVTFDSERRGGGFPGGNRGSEFIGNFRSSNGPLRSGFESKIVRVLKITDDRRAELVTRYQEREPELTRANLSLHGSLLRDVLARKRIAHSGTWRAFGRRLEVTLTSLDGDNRTRSQMTFEFRNNSNDELVTIDWNRNDYGTFGFNFRRMVNDDEDDQDQYGKPTTTPDRLAGTYWTRLQLPDSDGEIERTLQLSPNGDARLTTEWVGSPPPRISFRAQQELGRLLRRLEGQRSIVHSGRWQFRNNQIVIDFDNLDRVREPGSMAFDIRGDTLESARVDQTLYGNRSFRLARRR